MRYIVLIVVAAATASCGRPSPAEWSVEVQRLESPAGRNSSEPQLEVSDRGVLLSWIEREGPVTTLKYAERTASGWTQPVTAASGSGWFLSYADVPSVMRKSDGTLVAQWLPSTETMFEGYDLFMSFSKDNGKTWAPPFKPHHDDTRFQHGFASFVELPGNGLGVIWLDGRNSEYIDNDPASGTMTLRYATFDANFKQTSETEIDHNVCECCPTAIAMTDDGLLAAYRNRSDKEIRDIAVSRLEAGKWTPERVVHNDNWEIYACPVNGPALSVRGRDAAIGWFTVKNDQGQAYAAFSRDAGRTWGTPVRLDDGGSFGRVDIDLLEDGTAVASWVEAGKPSAQLRVRLIDPAGVKSAPVTVANVGGGMTGGFPRMARQGDELIFAWTEAGTDGDPATGLVHTARALLP